MDRPERLPPGRPGRRLRTIQSPFHPNALDLLTMAELSAHILEASA